MKNTSPKSWTSPKSAKGSTRLVRILLEALLLLKDGINSQLDPDVIDIDARKLPSAQEVQQWSPEQFTAALRHDPRHPAGRRKDFRQALVRIAPVVRRRTFEPDVVERDLPNIE